MKFSIKDFFSKCDQIRRKLCNFLYLCSIYLPISNIIIDVNNSNNDFSNNNNSDINNKNNNDNIWLLMVFHGWPKLNINGCEKNFALNGTWKRKQTTLTWHWYPHQYLQIYFVIWL